MLNLATLLEHQAGLRPTKCAFVLGDTRLSYAEINGAASQVAHYLQSVGIEPGDKVALSCPNLPWFPIIYYGILKAGAAVVPLNVLLKRREIAYHLKDSEAKAYFCFEGSEALPMGAEGHAGFEATASCEQFVMITVDPAAAPQIEGCLSLGQALHGRAPAFDAAPTSSEDTAVILYTSGTTGQPKGAELSHSNMVMNAMVSRDFLHLSESDVGLIVLPLFHSFGQTVLMNGLVLSGGTSVLLPRFDSASVLALLAGEKVTVFAGVPTMFWALMAEEKGSAASLRIAVSGGAALPLEVLRGFEKRFDVPILEGYGLSETSPVASFNQLDRERKPGSIGLPVWGVEMKIFDAEEREVPVDEAGEVVIRGHNVMKGYYRRPEETAKAMLGGWFHTGDIGKRDGDGYFYIVDRSKDMIIRGGFNVYPREIEEVLLTHEAVSMAAVIGIPDAESGEEILACVVLNPETTLEPADLIAWAKDRMAAYKYPRRVEIRDHLPMNATGKILKTTLRAELAEQG